MLFAAVHVSVRVKVFGCWPHDIGGRTQGRAQRQLQAWPLHRRDDRHLSVAEASNPRSEGADPDIEGRMN